MTERIKREDGEWRVVDDMGRVIQRLRVAPKGPAAAEITTIVAGYKKATITKMPRKTEGAVELEVRLDPVDSGVSTAGVNTTDGAPYTKTLFLLLGFFVLFIIGRGARTLGRPQTTKH